MISDLRAGAARTPLLLLMPPSKNPLITRRALPTPTPEDLTQLQACGGLDVPLMAAMSAQIPLSLPDDKQKWARRDKQGSSWRLSDIVQLQMAELNSWSRLPDSVAALSTEKTPEPDVDFIKFIRPDSRSTAFDRYGSKSRAHHLLQPTVVLGSESGGPIIVCT